LNKKTCDGKKHFLKDCPSTSKEEAHRLFDERRQALKVRRAKIKEAKAEKRRKLERVKKAKIMQQHDVRKCKSAIRFMLEGMLIDAAAEDTGADATVVPDKVVAKMEQRGLAVERIKLEKALVFKTARADGPEITYRTKIIVKRLTCQVRGVSVVFRSATLFVSNDIEEMLIGRDILDKTGFSFAEHLTKNVGTLNEMDLSSEGTSEQAPPKASSQCVGNISRLAVFGGYERYEGDLAIEADTERLRRVKPVRMPDLPPTHGSDPLENEQPEIEIGENTVEELAETRKGLIDKALKAGFPAEYAPAMRDLLEEFQDIFRIRLDHSPHADVAPTGADVQPDIKPSRAPPSHYNPRQRSFISTYCDKLLRNKLAVKIKTSDWVSPPLLVKKGPPAYFRFTLDLRGPNYATRKHDFVMENLEEEPAKLSGGK
jgi:hypothetical protein